MIRVALLKENARYCVTQIIDTLSCSLFIISFYNNSIQIQNDRGLVKHNGSAKRNCKTIK